MSLDSFVAGRYAGSYNSVDVGYTTDGYQIQQDSKSEVINSTDNYGDSAIDLVFRGGDVFLITECKAFKAGSIAPFWPWGTLGVLQTYGAGGAQPVGRLGSNIGAPMILSATQGTAYNTPGAFVINSLTGGASILAENSPATLLFTSRLRVVPVRLRFLPYETIGGGGLVSTKWFLTS